MILKKREYYYGVIESYDLFEEEIVFNLKNTKRLNGENWEVCNTYQIILPFSCKPERINFFDVLQIKNCKDIIYIYPKELKSMNPVFMGQQQNR
ncbi:hypothetical protein C0583_04355 [Candidatus Parcubacteria bacterium]|nr:MAG: hypothetical protein C0583_04355 [Candidatus Parcubacteria bacterium]